MSAIQMLNSPSTNTKYICGCGKTYTSYPAFSTHRKIKHDNINIQGTILPKANNSKRGRPSYQFKKNQNTVAPYKKYYQGLTVVELGLLNLNSKYENKIISQANQNMTCQFPEQFIELCCLQQNNEKQIQLQKIQNQIFQLQAEKRQNLSQIILLFIELMITHLNRRPAEAVITFFSDFAIFAYENSQIKENSSQLLRMSLFNQFFRCSQKKQLVDQLQCNYGLKFQFFVDISVIFSEWMFKMGFSQKTLKIKQKNQSTLSERM